MNKKDTIRKINELFQVASKLALELVESEARKILATDLELDEFVMAMGRCFFTVTNKDRGHETVGSSNIIDDDSPAEELAPFIPPATLFEFFDMVEDLNDRFKIRGCPMRFTANGKIIGDW